MAATPNSTQINPQARSFDASRQITEFTERFTQSFNLPKEEAERLANQSKQNLDAVTRCGTVLGQGFQDVSQGWFELGQKQWQRNLAAVNKLAQARTVQEFAATQIELVREGIEGFVQDSKGIAERSLRSVEEAGKIVSGATKQTAQAVQRTN